MLMNLEPPIYSSQVDVDLFDFKGKSSLEISGIIENEKQNNSKVITYLENCPFPFRTINM